MGSVRRCLGVLALLVAVVALSPTNGTAAVSADWAMPGRGPGHAGFNPGETTIGSGNVGRLTTRWSATTWFSGASPAVVNGVAYVAAGGGRLYAFDARGSRGCSGRPATCAPLWTATVGGNLTEPTVVGNVVYATGFLDASHVLLYAFDARGSTGCSGSPRVCRALWSAPLGSVGSPPTVSGGIAYVLGGSAASTKVMAFDAGGRTGCSAATRRCAPLWTATMGSTQWTLSPVAVANGLVFAATDAGRVSAFSATGSTGCSGTPKACRPVWTASDPSNPWLDGLAVDGTSVYLTSVKGVLSVYDARGVGCTGTPKICSPLWTAPVDYVATGAPAIAAGVVYVPSRSKSLVGRISAFDARGSSSCSGTPKVCRPLWTGRTADRPFDGAPPAVANGVVYVTSNQGRVQGFDARGSMRCSGKPKTCAALWTQWTPGGYPSSPVVAGGLVYLSNEKAFYAFGLPR